MNTKISLLILLLLLTTIRMFSQKQTYFGFETGVASDFYNFTDSGNRLETIPNQTGTWGFNIEHEINNYFSIETGLIRKHYRERYWFKSISTSIVKSRTTEAANVWQIPLLFNSRITLPNQKVSLLMTLGYHFCINSDYDTYGHGASSLITSTDTLVFNYSSNSNITKSFSLIETGLGIEYKVFNKVILTLSGSYFTGFREAVGFDINYKVNSEPTETANAHSKGEYWRVTIGVRYSISSLWRKQTRENGVSVSPLGS